MNGVSENLIYSNWKRPPEAGQPLAETKWGDLYINLSERESGFASSSEQNGGTGGAVYCGPRSK